MITNDPYNYLASENANVDQLDEGSKLVLHLYDRALVLHQQNPKSKDMAYTLEKAGGMAVTHLKKYLEEIRQSQVSETEKQRIHTDKKEKSRIVKQQAAETLDDLEICRQRLREEHARKLESGEIKKPVKKTPVKKLRDEMMRMANLMPEKLKDNTDVIKQTRKALLRFLAELKKIWGLTKIEPIEKELMEKFDLLEDKAA